MGLSHVPIEAGFLFPALIAILALIVVLDIELLGRMFCSFAFLVISVASVLGLSVLLSVELVSHMSPSCTTVMFVVAVHALSDLELLGRPSLALAPIVASHGVPKHSKPVIPM